MTRKLLLLAAMALLIVPANAQRKKTKAPVPMEMNPAYRVQDDQ